jgi:hypothetical protein
MEAVAKEARKRRGRIPFSEKLADLDARIKAAEMKTATLKAERAAMVDQRKAEAAAMLKELA